MKKLKSYRKLGRTSSARRALLRNLATSFFQHGRIKTTLPKAKELQPIVEKLITKGRSNKLHSKRIIASYLFDKSLISYLSTDLGQRFSERNGGYTRIIKLETRFGDGAEMCNLELVDYQAHEGKVKGEESKARLQAKIKKEENSQKSA